MTRKRKSDKLKKLADRFDDEGASADAPFMSDRADDIAEVVASDEQIQANTAKVLATVEVPL